MNVLQLQSGVDARLARRTPNGNAIDDLAPRASDDVSHAPRSTVARDATDQTTPARDATDATAQFVELYRRDHGAVLRFVERRIGRATSGNSQVEDVVHNAFLTAWRNFDKVPTEPGAARAWLYVVARNALLNAQRSEARRGALGVKIATETPSYLTGPENDVTARVDLAVAWSTLTPGQQEVISLAVWDELSSAEAARVLGISATAYRVRLLRARTALRKALEPPA